MKTKRSVIRVFGIFFLFLCVYGLTSCKDDNEGFSSSQIRQALFDMKGTYRGIVRAGYYQGSNIAELPEAIAVSSDSLSFTMSLLPMAEAVDDEYIAQCLREIGEITVIAGYDFLQMDNGVLHFVLYPKDVLILGGFGAPPGIRIVFSQIFGGDADVRYNSLIYNISPIELWVEDQKYGDFKQLVYHFEGVYE